MVISGHRTTYGAPFKDNGELVRGDEILIDTALTTYVYHVTGRDIVRPSTVEVAAPVPFHPGREPRKTADTDHVPPEVLRRLPPDHLRRTNQHPPVPPR